MLVIGKSELGEISFLSSKYINSAILFGIGVATGAAEAEDHAGPP